MAWNPLYYAWVECVGCASAVAINDVTIVADALAEGIVTAELINSWVLPGTNELKVQLQQPRGREYTPGEAEGLFRVFIADPNEEAPKPGTVLQSLRWPTPVPEVYPFAVALPFEVKQAPPVRLWEEAERIEKIQPEDQFAIHHIMKDLQNALRSGDANRTYALQEYKYEEMARAEYKTVDRVREAILKQHEWLAGLGRWEGELPPVDALRYSLVADRRVVNVNRLSGEPAVKIEQVEGTHVAAIPVYASRIKGKWTLVR